MLVEGIELDENNMPKHLGIIMDGNSRWAKQNNLSRFEGHKQGVAALKKILNFSYDILKLDIISLYAFSIENWKRTKEEVSFLMKLFVHFYKNEFKEIKKRGVKVVHSGIKEGLSKSVLKMLNNMVEETKDYKNGVVNLAFNYGGRNEIINAVKKIVLDVKENKLDLNNIDEDLFSEYLSNPELPDPDLIIRTSGELRISNFLLWQVAYSEFYFTETYWPEFSPKHLVEAIYDFQKRDRRYGGR